MPQNRTETGRFAAGTSGNPGGRPRGLARAVRELVGEDGGRIVEFWLEIMLDPAAKTADRLEASKLLADRGFGKAPMRVVAATDDNPERFGVYRETTPERAMALCQLATELAPESREAALARALDAGATLEQIDWQQLATLPSAFGASSPLFRGALSSAEPTA